VITTPLVNGLDLVATFAFALVGARVAAAKGLDYGGILLISAVSSLTGGTFRNVFLGQRPPWILHAWLFSAVLLAFVVTVIAKNVKPVGRFMLSLDTFGLAVATASSANYAISYGAGFVGALVLAVLGAVLGGLLRDLFCQVEPVLLHRETIGTSCFAGALLYLTLQHFDFSTLICAFSSGVVVILVRELSIHFDWDLPKLIHERHERHERHEL